MDLSKIFLKNACPTSMGGQAVMEGVMMRGESRMAVAIRIPDGRIHIKTEPIKKPGPLTKIPILRGVVAFLSSIVIGMRTLLYSADVMEHYGGFDEEGDDSSKEPGKFETWLTEKFGEKAAWNIAMYLAVVFAIAMTVGIFILLPTAVVSFLGKFIESPWIMNLIEGVFRLVLFVGYILLISRMEDIRRVFQYHGAEHETIHCFENGLELTPENADQFYTLHPRCGTSFLIFVFVISLILFSMLGWPNLLMRLLSRIILLPLVAGISYEVLKWAGRSDNMAVKILSLPGLYMQKLTTKKPSKNQLEVAIASVKAVMVPEGAAYIEGICDKDANLLEEVHIGEEK